MIKLSTDAIHYITLFEKMTGATVKDCITNEDEVVFLVKNGDMGLAIGKKGIAIKKVRDKVGKTTVVMEYSNDPAEFIKNLFKPVNLKEIKITNGEDKKIITITISQKDKKYVIGKNGKNIKRAKVLAKRHHDIGDIIVQW